MMTMSICVAKVLASSLIPAWLFGYMTDLQWKLQFDDDPTLTKSNGANSKLLFNRSIDVVSYCGLPLLNIDAHKVKTMSFAPWQH
ncbi:hypothetical protein Plhal304r1_c043g0122951 [Plasmopara halstedii]